MTLGLVVGVGAALATGIKVNGVPLLAWVGFVKLTIIAALGLIAGGAFMVRMAKRQDERRSRQGNPHAESA